MSLGIRGIEESWLYQEYFQKGKAEGIVEGKAEGIVEGDLNRARKDLLRLGRKRLGPPGEAIAAEIGKIEDPKRLDVLLERVLDASSWEELLAPAAS